MFGQNRLMGEEVSIFNGADFGTMATTQTRSARAGVLGVDVDVGGRGPSVGVQEG